MKKRARLTQEQLKVVLQGWKTLLLACHAWDIGVDGEHLSDEHVYTQIEELIEDSGMDEDLAAWMDRCHEMDVEVHKLRLEKYELGVEVAELREKLKALD